MRPTVRSLCTGIAALAALACAAPAASQTTMAYWYAPPAPVQYMPAQAPYWPAAYSQQPTWGYGYPTAQAPAWPTAYAGAQPTTTARTRATRPGDPFRAFANDPFFNDPFFGDSLFDDPFFTQPWGFDSMLPSWGWPSSYGGAGRTGYSRSRAGAGAGMPMPGQAWAGAPSMLGYGGFGSNDFWNWARFGDFGDGAWSGGSASHYSYSARNSNGQCVRMTRSTSASSGSAPQTVTHRDNNCAGTMPVGAGAGFRDWDDWGWDDWED